ncbi:hypothetical protein Tco_0424213 [Tanacetum coccineum]
MKRECSKLSLSSDVKKSSLLMYKQQIILCTDSIFRLIINKLSAIPVVRAIGNDGTRINIHEGPLRNLIAFMSSASSAVTYTSVYTDSEPGRVFWGADEEISDGEVPRVIVLGYDGLPMQPVAPPSPDYVPGPEHPASPDYVPGPEHPPSPIEIPFVPEPEYPSMFFPENGNSFKPAAQTTTNAEGTSTTLIPGPVTADEKIQKKNDVKARSMLLMAIPNEHLPTFNQYKDAKTLFAAIQTRYGGNDATKKTQKTLLKQMYENFSAPSTESLDSIFNRLQKIVSQLAILGENISQEDLNLKFLRSLPSEWNTHVVVWRNKHDLDTMSFDDLYNNFKIVEQEVKGTASSSSSSISTANTQVSTASTQVSTANLSDDTIYAFLASQPNGSHLVHEDLEQIHEDDLEEIDLKWQLALLSMRTRRFYQKTGRKITINGSDTAGYDKSKNQDSSRKTVNVEETSSKAMLAIDGADFDWSFMADEKVPTNMALMDFSDSEFNKSEFNLATYKRGLASVEEHLVFYKKNELEKIKQEKESIQLTIENFDNASKSLDKLIRSQITDNNRKGVGFVSYNAIPPPPIGLFSPPNLDLSNSGLEEFQQPEFEGYGPKTSKSISEDISNEVRKSPDAALVEKLVSNEKLKKRTVFPTKIEFVRPKQQEKPVKYAKMYKSQGPRGN